MKTTSKKSQPVLLFMYLVLFTTATGTYSGMACQLSTKNTNNCQDETAVVKTEKKAGMRVMNPLQILTSKFM
ncbi:MAG: hypothetical protein V4717_10150 [Bacteroidota bacterium]